MPAQTATFIERNRCIACGGGTLDELSTGLFSEGAVKQFIDSDPWGEHPAPFLAGQRWAYVRCQSCSQAFHRFILSPEWNERRFAKWMSQAAIEAFERKVRSPERALAQGTSYAAHALRLEALTRDVRAGAAARVLDFGCGYGKFLSMCALFGLEAVGVDRSSARRENSVVPIHAEIADVSGAPFHALTLFEVLEHLDDPRALLADLAELLVPGGILIVETPNCEGVTRIDTRRDYLKIHPLEHINGFTPATLQALATGLGFERIHPPAAYVTTDLARLVRTGAKRALGPLLRDNTQQYFRKRGASQGRADSRAA